MKSNSSSFSKLLFTHDFVDAFSGDPETQNYPRAVREALYSLVLPEAVSSPKLIGWSDALAKELGIVKPDASDSDSLAILSGNQIAKGMKPYSARYGGHQFGQWAGQLGDGRAITLGEANTSGGKQEFQLKGAGPTPYSRRGDGRAVLRSSLREFLCSEAMHFLRVPTTRCLSLVITGDKVVRDFFYDGNPKEEPGAIVCRVSPTFLRFGNFEILARQNESELLKKLVDFTIDRFYPGLSYVEFLNEVSIKTATLIAHWMRVGFVHGVMNTDNMSILGLTLDYGPYGWLEPYELEFTPNTTDAEHKRYSFGNQAGIGLWNIARFAESLSPLIQDRSLLEESLNVYRRTFDRCYTQFVSEKLGFLAPKKEDEAQIAEVFSLMIASQADYTNFFRTLSEARITQDLFPKLQKTFYGDCFDTELNSRWSQWIQWYVMRIQSDGRTEQERQFQMKRVNPKYVLRNYLAQNAIIAAENGDYSKLNRLLKVLENPYEEQGESDLAEMRPEWAKNSPGSSTLSCSS